MGTVILQAIISGLMMGGVYGILAVGMSLVLGVAGISQLVHGDMLMAGHVFYPWRGHALGS